MDFLEEFEFHLDLVFSNAFLVAKDHALTWNHSVIGGCSIAVKDSSSEMH